MGEIFCADCEKEFGEEDTVYECQECHEPICDDCKEKHFCIDEADDHNNETCIECGNCEEEMFEFEDNYYCNNCVEETKKDRQEQIFNDMEEFEYNDYLKEKIADNL